MESTETGIQLLQQLILRVIFEFRPSSNILKHDKGLKTIGLFRIEVAI